MVEWAKHLSVFWPVSLTSVDVDRGLGWQVTKELPQTLVWSYFDLAGKTFPVGFRPKWESLSSRPGFDYRACACNAPLRHATG